MKKVSDILSKNDFRLKIEKNIKKILKKDILKTNKNIPNFWKKMCSKKIIILSIFFLFTSFIFLYFLLNKTEKSKTIYLIFFFIFIFISVLLMFLFFLFRKKILVMYRKSINYNKIMFFVFNSFDELELEEIIENKTMNGLRKYSFSEIPSNAKIYRKSSIFKLKLKKKYNVEVQTATFLYYVYVWSYVQKRMTWEKHFKNSSIIKINLKNIQLDHSFSLINNVVHDSSILKIKLENDQFNKKMNVYSNNRIKIRMIYTPLTMESVLKLYNKIPLKKIRIQKIKEKVIINFENIFEQLELNSNFYKNVDKIIDLFFEDILTDTYIIYQLLGFFIIPPLL